MLDFQSLCVGPVLLKLGVKRKYWSEATDERAACLPSRRSHFRPHPVSASSAARLGCFEGGSRAKALVPGEPVEFVETTLARLFLRIAAPDEVKRVLQESSKLWGWQRQQH